MGKGDKQNDSELWERVVETATPLHKSRSRLVKEAPASPRPAKPPTKTPAKSFPPKPKPAPKPIHVPREAALDRQTSRRLDRGRIAVDARLDLHGMRQRDAHAALRRFLKSAQGKGHRHVLVITGKGTTPEAARSFYEEEARGVLRQAVPHWLNDPEFASIVVSFSAAPRRLGGEGALYVRLRKSQR